MAFNLFSSKYAAAFSKDQPEIDEALLRKKVVEHISAHKAEMWGEAHPVRTVLKHVEITPAAEGKLEDTLDAFGAANGKILLSPAAHVDAVLAHIKAISATQKAAAGTPAVDLRDKVRRIEDKLFSNLDNAAVMVGNQALDFSKQDGMTEVAESVQALLVERKLNDDLLEAEMAGKVAVSRSAAFVGCVSNFSIFLDLCRKSLRNLELGVPLVILSRSNTTQYIYRWVMTLLNEMKAEGIDTGMVTFLACSIDDQRRVLAACTTDLRSVMYFTGSRFIANKIKEVMPRLVASTGGPNTMVAESMTEQVGEALRMSHCIEHKGQCTALRHAVLPAEDAVLSKLDTVYSKAKQITHVKEAIEQGEFSAIFSTVPPPKATNGYEVLKAAPVAVRITDDLPKDINEMWREMYLDVTSLPNKEAINDPAFLQRLADWLNTEQPISLAVNCAETATAEFLFEHTGMVVNTIGTPDRPALSAQARPQDGELFGEFPPRHMMKDISWFPVIVPSSTPGYNTSYPNQALVASAKETLPAAVSKAQALKDAAQSELVKGYVQTLAAFLEDALAENPKRGVAQGRTALYGMQKPPTGLVYQLRADATTTVDQFVPFLVPFALTNAGKQLRVSMHPESACKSLVATLKALNLEVVEEDAAPAMVPSKGVQLPQVFQDLALEAPLAAHFISLLLPVGHVKSVVPQDEAFVATFKKNPRWLSLA